MSCSSTQRAHSRMILFLFIAGSAVMLGSVLLGCALLPGAAGLYVGLGFMLVAIVPHCVAHRLIRPHTSRRDAPELPAPRFTPRRHSDHWYLLSIAFNCIGCGLCVSAYDRCNCLSAELPVLAASLLPPLAVFLIVICIARLSAKAAALTGILLMLALMVPEVVFWIRTGAVFYSSAFFFTVFTGFFLCAFGAAWTPARNPLRMVSFSCFGALLVIALIVAMLLSEGELLDGLDFDLSGKRSSPKKARAARANRPFSPKS